jgi:general secretion pathway protein F
MPRFSYWALSPSGEVVSGELDGPNPAAIIDWLHEQALVPIDAVEKPASRTGAFGFQLFRPRSVPLPDLALLSKQLARLLRAGLPLDRALEIVANLSTDRRSHAAVRGSLERVRDGAGLAEAMLAQGNAFPQSYISMIRAGEQGSALYPVLVRLADFLTRAEANRQKIMSALIYPAILIVVAALSLVLVLTIVLPQFEPLFAEAGAKLPVITRIIIAVGHVLREAWWVIFLAVAVILLVGRQLMQLPAVAVERDRVTLWLPIVGELVRKFEIGRFARTFGVLLSNGVSSPRALALVGATIGNRIIAQAIEDVAARLKEGGGLSEPLARTGRFPSLATELIHIGEETGRLEEMLHELAEIYDEELERNVQRLIALLVPALTIGMGLVVALMIAAVMTAVLSINDLAI